MTGVFCRAPQIGGVFVFWDKYVELCTANGKNPTPVAIEIGFSNAAAAHWKSGQTPRPATIKKIADYFGVSTDFFSDFAPSPQPQSARSDEFVELYNALNESEQKLIVAQMKGILSNRE
jgi:transcriptional regulator with XRE-family HTH domain